MTASQTLRGGGRGWVLVTVSCGWLLVLGTRLVIPALLPVIKADFGINNATAGFAVSLLLITYAAMQFPAGAITDRRGERIVLLVAMGLGFLGVVLIAVAPVFAVFLAACALYGAGTGLFGAPRVTLLSDIYPRHDGIALGVTFAAGSVGAAALPFLAGFVSTRVGWQIAFGAFLPAFALVTVGMWRALPRDRSPDPRAAASPRRVWRRLRVVLAHRPVVLVGGATTLMVFSYQGFTAFLTTYLVTIKGLSPSAAATLFGLFFATGAVVQPLAGGAADRYGDRPVLLAVAGSHVLALLALPFVTDGGVLAALVVVLGLRAGAGPINNAYLVAALPTDVQGAGYGLVRTVYMGIGSVGSVAVGLFADANRFDEAFFVLSGIVAVAVGLYVLLPPRGSIDASAS